MLFNSLDFLWFFPVVAVLYYLLPHKIRYIWLLIGSYYFYMCWNPQYALLILTSTATTYLSSILIGRIRNSDKLDERHSRCVAVINLVINLGILMYFKYTNFLLDTMQGILGVVGIELAAPNFDIILPVGISFYTFQALGYTLDVYRGNVAPEKNFLKYALFVSFFPQLVAGPIERSENLLSQIGERHKFSFENIREGLMLMLWGYFLKIVIADRTAIFVDAVYGDYATYNGWYLIIATILFAVQIYCDFAGYSVIAMGAAKVMGFRLMDNFNAPYFSQSVSEFWRRWHISLFSWFRDYLYIPLGGSRKGIFRKYLNIMIVFLVSGLWHGAGLTFIIWGGCNGLYQIIGSVLKPIRDKVVSFWHINRQAFSHKLLKMIATFVLVDFSWIFFRASDMTSAIDIIKSMVHADNIWIFFDDSLFQLGLTWRNFIVMLLSMGVLIFADFLKNRNIIIRDVLIRQGIWFRWLVLLVGIAVVFTFGIWGSGYDKAAFIYFQF